MRGRHPKGKAPLRRRQGSAFKDAALAYAQLGYAILPCRRLGKAPLTKSGLKDASTCPQVIEAWWQHQPLANVGLLPPKEVLVLDLDDPLVARRWEIEHPVLREAPTARTPHGGTHVYLRLSDGMASPKAHVKVKGEAVDVRGLSKAYLIAPPSRIRDGHYSWERPLVTPNALPVLTLELLERLSPKLPEPKRPAATVAAQGEHIQRYALAALQDECAGVSAALEGSRNATLNKAAFSLGQLVAAGTLERSEVEAALEAAAAVCGLPEGEAFRTIRSGLEAGLAQPRDLGQSLHLRQPMPAPNQARSGQAKPHLGHVGKKVRTR